MHSLVPQSVALSRQLLSFIQIAAYYLPRLIIVATRLLCVCSFSVNAFATFNYQHPLLLKRLPEELPHKLHHFDSQDLCGFLSDDYGECMCMYGRVNEYCDC